MVSCSGDHSITRPLQTAEGDIIRTPMLGSLARSRVTVEAASEWGPQRKRQTCKSGAWKK